MEGVRSHYRTLALLVLAVAPFLPALDNYYFYDDGRVLREATRVEREGPHVIVEDGFNGHFRPLPIASAWVIDRIFGFESPRPFHLLAIGLHAINVLLIYRLLRTLFPDQHAVAFFAAAVCAVQWAATEAVTYISAIGMLWSALGGLIAALAAVRWRSHRDYGSAALLVAGVIISLGGGEYGIAFAPAIMTCAIWPDSQGKLRWRQATFIALMLMPIYAAYVAWSLAFHDHGRVGAVYCFGNHIFVQITDNLSYLFLPNKWIRKWPSLALLATFLATASVASNPFRACLFSRKSGLLLAATLAAVVPFSFSLLGNYYRFLYPAMALSSAWLFWLVDSLLQPDSMSPRTGRRVLAGVGVFLIVANVINGAWRARDEGRRGQEVARFVRQLDELVAENPHKPVAIYIDQDVESTIDTVVALGRIDRARCLGSVPSAVSPGEIILVGHYAWGKPFQFEIHGKSSTASVDDVPNRR